MKTKHVERAWLAYRELVIPADAPAIQISETRMGFYAGASAVYLALTIGVSGADTVTASDVELLESIADEVRAFYAETQQSDPRPRH